MLVVVDILAAILLPDAPTVRECAPRASCQNNLHQIGLATPLYHRLHNQLEPAWISIDEIDDPVWGRPSFWLPLMEQAHRHNKINFNIAVHQPVHLESVKTSLGSTACPSDFSSGGKDLLLPDEPPVDGLLDENKTSSRCFSQRQNPSYFTLRFLFQDPKQNEFT